MKTVYIVFSTDAWHSHTSKVLFGVFTSHEIAVKTIKKTHKLNEWDITSLCDINQTQGRNTNFVIEEITINTALI